MGNAVSLNSLALDPSASGALPAAMSVAVSQIVGTITPGGVTPVNLVGDPFLWNFGLSGLTTGGLRAVGTQGTNYTIVRSDPENPYATVAMRRITGNTGLFGRILTFAQMGLAVGDIISIVVPVAVPAGCVYNGLEAFYRNAGGSVVGSQQTPDIGNAAAWVPFSGPGVVWCVFTNRTIPATAVQIDVRTNAPVLGAFLAASGGAVANKNAGELILGTGCYRSIAPTGGGVGSDATSLYVGDMQSRMGVAPRRQIVLPSKMYCLLGGTGSPTPIEEFNLYFPNFINKAREDFIDVATAPASRGRQYGDPSRPLGDLWRMQPGNTADANYPTAAGTMTATINLIDSRLNETNLLNTATTTLEVMDKTAKTTRASLMLVGDSNTRPNTINGRVKATLSNVDCVGTRTYDSGTTSGEGRSGWTLAQYMRQAGQAHGATLGIIDSPFLFPPGVAAANYRGNTNWWKEVVNNTSSETDGFQLMAKEWGGSYVFDASTGYPTAPAANDVVYDPTKSAGSELQKWNGSAWATLSLASVTNISATASTGATSSGALAKFTRSSGSWITDGYAIGSVIATSGFTNGGNNGTFTVVDLTDTDLKVNTRNPLTESASAGHTVTLKWQLDISKYFTRFSNAFKQTGSFHAPDAMALMLGTNEFQGGTGLGVNLADWMQDLSVFIVALRAYSSTMPFIICPPMIGAQQDAWGLDLGSGGTAARFRQNMIDQTQRVIDVYDNATSLSANIYVCPMLHCVDPIYGFDTITEAANKYVATTITRQSGAGWVHPGDTTGRLQAGDTLASIFQKVRP